MLSPYKLYKYDKKLARKPVTRNAHVKVCGASGSPCYNHYNVDWTIHRLIPTLADRGKPNGKRRKVIGKISKEVAPSWAHKARDELQHSPQTALPRTSPRWGEGINKVPRKVAPLAKKGTVEVSKGTKVVTVGAGTALAAGIHRRSTHQGVSKKANV